MKSILALLLWLLFILFVLFIFLLFIPSSSSSTLSLSIYLRCLFLQILHFIVKVIINHRYIIIIVVHILIFIAILWTAAILEWLIILRVIIIIKHCCILDWLTHSLAQTTRRMFNLLIFFQLIVLVLIIKVNLLMCLQVYTSHLYVLGFQVRY